jgi:D-amino-acid dehydrogenase
VKVLVIGGGVIGLCCARAAARRGADVVLLERDRCGGGASLENAGWIVPTFSTPLPEPGAVAFAVKSVLKRTGSFAFRVRPDPALPGWYLRFLRASSERRWLAGTAAILRLNRRTMELFDELRESGVVFDMQERGVLFVARGDDEMRSYRRHLEALLRVGYRGRVEFWDQPELRAREPALADDTTGAMYAHDERHVRAESLVQGISDAARVDGVEIVEQAPVVSLFRSRGKWHVTTVGDVRVADRVVIAAGAWSSVLLRGLGVRLPIQAAKGYSLTAHSEGGAPSRPIYAGAIRVACSPYEDGLRVAGMLELAGLDSTVKPGRIATLLEGVQHYLPEWRPTRVRSTWAGLRPLAPDGLPVVGALPGQDGLFVATAHGMLGVTLAPATAELLMPLVLDDQLSEDLVPFSPARF